MVYRCYAADGALLYVGSSGVGVARLLGHRLKPWWRRVTTVTLERHETHAAALLAEREAIRSEEPRHNVIRYARPPRPRGHGGETSATDLAATRPLVAEVARLSAVHFGAQRELRAAVVQAGLLGASESAITRESGLARMTVRKILGKP